MKNREERIEAFKKIDLYPVISSEFTLGRPVPEVFRACAEGGARIVQLREKHAGKGELYRLALECRKIADAYDMLLMIDDHVDVALAAGADGVHLGMEDLPVNAARKIAPELIFGVSTHNMTEALDALGSECDYLNVGPVFETRTKEVGYPPVGLDELKRIVPELTKPFTVMGGIKAGHIASLLNAGACRIAMVTEVTQAPDVAEQVKKLRSAWRNMC